MQDESSTPATNPPAYADVANAEVPSASSNMNAVIKQVAMIVVAIMVFGGLANFVMSLKDISPPVPPADGSPVVNLERIQRRKQTLDVSVNGKVSPRARAVIVAEVAGRLVAEDSHFVEGATLDADYVTGAQNERPLLRIDDADWTTALLEAEAAHAQALAAVEQAKAGQAQAEAAIAEVRAAIALREAQLQQAQAGIGPAEAQVEIARAEVERASANLKLEEAQAAVARQEWESYQKDHPDAVADPLVLREPQLKQARANASASEASLKGALEGVRAAKANVDAAKEMVASARASMLVADAGVQAAVAGLKLADANVRAAEPRVERALLNQARTRIGVPYPCRILKTMVSEGQYVTAGTPLCEIMPTDELELRLPVPRDQMAFINLPMAGDLQLGTAADIRLTGAVQGEIRTWNGRYHRSLAEIDSATGVFTVVLRIPNVSTQSGGTGIAPLLAGQYLTATLPGREQEVIEVPRSAFRVRASDTLEAAAEEDKERGLMVGWLLVASPISEADMEQLYDNRAQDVAKEEDLKRFLELAEGERLELKPRRSDGHEYYRVSFVESIALRKESSHVYLIPRDTLPEGALFCTTAISNPTDGMVVRVAKAAPATATRTQSE